jgi:predicted DNA-binding transcriptional regulator YafY
VPDNRNILIDYTNYKGERRWRLVRPMNIWFGISVYHHQPQWFMHADDVEKSQVRDFALTCIHAVQPEPT